VKEAPAAVEQRHGVLGGVFVLLALYLGASVAVGPGVPGAASCLSAHAAMGPVGSCFRAGSVWLLGLPATVLIPIALGAHGLRLYGLTKQDTDRKWLWFLIGLMVLVPIGVGLAAPAAPGARSQWSGLWGGFASYYMDAWFSRGAWIWLAIFFLLLTGLTLAYDPLRALLASAARPRAAVTGHPNGKKAGSPPNRTSASPRRSTRTCRWRRTGSRPRRCSPPRRRRTWRDSKRSCWPPATA